MHTSVHDNVAKPGGLPKFQQYWLAETIRLREAQWGPLQDSNEIRRARAHAGGFAHRLLLRAGSLGKREGIDASLHQWASGAKLTLTALLVLALLTGAATAFGALGDGTRQVNLILALTALLGLNTLTFVFWLISSLIPSGDTHASLGELWLWLTRKLARGPLAALIPRALVGLLGRQGALRPLLGSISHALWLFALAAMLATLLALLSARRYTFGWETTLLSPDTFVWFTTTTGWLPSLFGFELPSEAVIRTSDGLHVLPDTAYAAWSSWLIGCLVCYGLLPRLLALIVTTIMTLKRIRVLDLDTRLPGYIELRERLEPASLTGGIDAPAPTDIATRSQEHSAITISSSLAIVGLELAHDVPWPPAALASHVADLGVIDDRQQRQHLLDALYDRSPEKLLIVCDGHQTPDRGTINLITEFAGFAGQARVLIRTESDLTASGSDAHQKANENESDKVLTITTRLMSWKEHLQKAGFSANNICTDQSQALAWLAASASDAPPPGSTA